MLTLADLPFPAFAMDFLVPESVMTQLGVEISSNFHDSLLLFCSGSASEKYVTKFITYNLST